MVMSPLKWLITGCSSGIGKVLAFELVERGDYVITTTRSVASLRKLSCRSNVHAMALDLNSPQETIDECILAAQEVLGGIDVLVNNASYLTGGPLEQVKGIHFEEVYKTNLFGTVNVTRAIMPHFRVNKAGMVVFIGSQFRFTGDVRGESYCATKFALEGFEQETALFGIKSIIVELGYFRNNLFDPSRLRIDIDPLYACRAFNEQQAAFASAIHGKQPGDPQKAALRIADVVRGEGMAEGKGLPKRLPLGSDAITRIRAKRQETLKICDEWEDIVRSTDF